MSEEAKNESSTSEPHAGGDNSTIRIVERVDTILKRLEDTEKRLDTKTKEYEQLLARNMLTGKSVLVQTEKKEETAQEYAKRVMAGKA